MGNQGCQGEARAPAQSPVVQERNKAAICNLNATTKVNENENVHYRQTTMGCRCHTQRSLTPGFYTTTAAVIHTTSSKSLSGNLLTKSVLTVPATYMFPSHVVMVRVRIHTHAYRTRCHIIPTEHLRWAAGKRLTDRLPKLVLITLLWGLTQQLRNILT